MLKEKVFHIFSLALQMDASIIRFVWSRSLHATAKIFSSLKENQDEPDASKAMRVRVSTDDGRGILYDKEVWDMCMNFILPGRDTTFAALSWFFWLLIQHPDVEKKVLLEIQRILD